jgi:hypothetical protein
MRFCQAASPAGRGAPALAHQAVDDRPAQARRTGARRVPESKRPTWRGLIKVFLVSSRWQTKYPFSDEKDPKDLAVLYLTNAPSSLYVSVVDAEPTTIFRKTPLTPRRFHPSGRPNYAFWDAGKLQTLAEVMARRRIRKLDWALIRNKRLGMAGSPNAEWLQSYRNGWQRRRRDFHSRQLQKLRQDGRKLRRRK